MSLGLSRGGTANHNNESTTVDRSVDEKNMDGNSTKTAIDALPTDIPDNPVTKSPYCRYVWQVINEISYSYSEFFALTWISTSTSTAANPFAGNVMLASPYMSQIEPKFYDGAWSMIPTMMEAHRCTLTRNVLIHRFSQTNPKYVLIWTTWTWRTRMLHLHWITFSSVRLRALWPNSSRVQSGCGSSNKSTCRSSTLISIRELRQSFEQRRMLATWKHR